MINLYLLLFNSRRNNENRIDECQCNPFESIISKEMVLVLEGNPKKRDNRPKCFGVISSANGWKSVVHSWPSVHRCCKFGLLCKNARRNFDPLNCPIQLGQVPQAEVASHHLTRRL